MPLAGDVFARARGAGHGDRVDAVVAGEHVADLAGLTGDEIERAVRNPVDVGDNVGEDRCGDGGLAGGLEQHAVTGRDRGRDL